MADVPANDVQNAASARKAKKGRAIILIGLSQDCLQSVNLTKMAKKSNLSAQFLMDHVAVWMIFLNC